MPEDEPITGDSGDEAIPDSPQGREPREVDPALEPHDPTGLTLARAIANSVGARSPRRRRPQQRRMVDPQSSGAHPDDRDPKTLSDAMERLVESKGWSKEISVHTLLGRWPVLVGPVNGAHSTPESYVDTVLTVRADSSVWASSLRAIASQLVARLNAELGDGTVTLIKVLGPEAPSWKRGRLSVRDGRGPRDTYG
jgi:predicted nucleic acid-binding Zn ribbon protein